MVFKSFLILYQSKEIYFLINRSRIRTKLTCFKYFLYTKDVTHITYVEWIWGITMTHKGIVKWFSNVKGYGFIEYDETEEIFVHFTGIQMEGYRTLKAGQHVEFKAVEGARGLQATDVVVLSEKDNEQSTTDDHGEINEK